MCVVTCLAMQLNYQNALLNLLTGQGGNPFTFAQATEDCRAACSSRSSASCFHSISDIPCSFQLKQTSKAQGAMS